MPNLLWIEVRSIRTRCRKGYFARLVTQLGHDLRIELPRLASLFLAHLLDRLPQMYHDIVTHCGRIVREQQEGDLPLTAHSLAAGHQAAYRFDTHGDAQAHRLWLDSTSFQYSPAGRLTGMSKCQSWAKPRQGERLLRLHRPTSAR